MTLLLAGLFMLAVSLTLDLLAGSAELSLSRIVEGILWPDSLDTRHRVILWSVRLPDALIAVSVGAALGLAGLETQTVLNNPLASPYTLGIASAATLGASIAIAFGPAFPFLPMAVLMPSLALVLALAAGGLVLLLTVILGQLRESVVLFGIALLFFCEAALALIYFVSNAEAVQQIVFWSIGNLTKAGWPEVGVVTLVLLLVLPFSLRQVWALTLLRGGEEQARSVGVDPDRLRRTAILRVSILTSFAVCFVGVIGFIGLVAPHIARLVLGEDHRYLLPGASLTGALLLSLASWLSKTLLPGVIIPVGILTAMIGVPFFVMLIVISHRPGR